ncbi:MAG: hypothetical protein SVC26_08040 [Pseudomonadota bacterium]|nr:hypothetical protein [Pseudomonadota bacterium]
MKRCLALICCLLMGFSLSFAVERISFFDSYQEPMLVLSSRTDSSFKPHSSSEFELLINEQYADIYEASYEDKRWVIEPDFYFMLSGVIIEVEPAEAAIRLQMQVKSQVSIQNEGPHLDLLEWKSQLSDLEVIPLDRQNRAVLPDIVVDQSAFPEFSKAELRAAVFGAGGQHWVKVLDYYDSLKLDYGEWISPVMILPSEVYIKVERWSDGQWIEVEELVFILPMGC